MPRYKLLAGLHVETGPDGCEHFYKAGDIFESDNPHHAIRRPEKFEATQAPTNTDPELTRHGPALHPENAGPGGQTYPATPGAARQVDSAGELHQVQALQAQGKQPESSSGTPLGQPQQGQQGQQSQQGQPRNKAEFHASLERMNVQQLRQVAEEEEVDVPPGAKKEDIIKAIKEQV